MDYQKSLEEELAKHLNAGVGIAKMVAEILNTMVDEPILDREGVMKGMSFKPGTALQMLFALSCFVWEKQAVAEAENADDPEKKAEFLKQAQRWSMKAAIHLTNEAEILVAILGADAGEQYAQVPESEWIQIEERMKSLNTDKDNLERLRIEAILRKHHEPGPGVTLH